MKFDVIIGNPPYQLSDGGHGRSAKPIYHKFIDQAKKMNPRFMSMIIPARWYAGGKGLDDFRESMLNDDRIRKLVDNEKSSNVFPGVDIAGGICYFLWDRDNRGLCEITNQYDNDIFKTQRALNEFNVLIRHGIGVSIVKKVFKIESPKYFLNKVVSPRKPFDLPTNYLPYKKGIPCHFTQKIGLKYAKPLDYKDKLKIKDKWKLLIPRSPIAGQTDFSKPVGFYYDGNIKIAKPGEICTESWLVACSFSNRDEVVSFKSYLFTKIVRFLLLQTVVSQDIPREKFVFIPYLEKYNTIFTDDLLRKRWKITDDEWSFIDSKIKSL
jgi:site-specific DNA-methyltransferase (adenine-specific)